MEGAISSRSGLPKRIRIALTANDEIGRGEPSLLKSVDLPGKVFPYRNHNLKVAAGLLAFPYLWTRRSILVRWLRIRFH
jgi:hypothetical protein